MKSYLSYKNQIQGFKDVSETIKTEEKIAASLIHFLEQEVFNLNTYADNLKNTLARLSVFYKKNQSPFLQENYGPKKLIVLTGNKGLTGGLWHRIIATFLENRRQYKSVITIGTKGESYLREEDAPITKYFSNLEDIPEKETIENITQYIFNLFRQKNISKIDILYPRFISLSEQTADII
ncbi:MAG TPA: hypothetical protein ENL05_01165, partial [Candidatus Moranbacteria bacterium]|nr:hypothetical protein [Candidatus Moranbacteria bacterium]